MIEQFRGENFFLSNMYPLENWIINQDGIAVPTSEHAYQSAKFTDLSLRKEVATARGNPVSKRFVDRLDGVASKNLASHLIQEGAEVREDWQIARLGIMRAIVYRKFNCNPDIAEKLVVTGDQELVEGNDWGDRFWGVDPVGSKNGQNNLGRILMAIRSRIQLEQ